MYSSKNYTNIIAQFVDHWTRDQVITISTLSPESLYCVLKQDIVFAALYWSDPGSDLTENYHRHGKLFNIGRGLHQRGQLQYLDGGGGGIAKRTYTHACTRTCMRMHVYAKCSYTHACTHTCMHMHAYIYILI